MNSEKWTSEFRGGEPVKPGNPSQRQSKKRTYRLGVPGWVESARRNSRSTLRDRGFPKHRDEYWKYTNPTLLDGFDQQSDSDSGYRYAGLNIDTEIPSSAPLVSKAWRQFSDSREQDFSNIDMLKVVFFDGKLAITASDPLALRYLEIESFEDAISSDPHWGSDIFGILEASGQRPITKPYAALNTLDAEFGLAIRATGKPSKPIGIIHERRLAGVTCFLRHIVRVEPGAELTLIEIGTPADYFNKVMEVDVKENGKFHHVQIQGNRPNRRAITHLFARAERQSVVKSFTLTGNCTVTRNESVIELAGEGSSAHLSGASAGDGVFHGDDTVLVVHKAPNCESRQVYKKVLRNGATGVFQGKILVENSAQKTDGYQMSQGLLLDDDSQFLVKPELEIYADDVACSHGSTCGGVNDEALFYLKSRGIPETEAKDILALAFLMEAVEEVEDGNVVDALKSLVNTYMTDRGD